MQMTGYNPGLGVNITTVNRLRNEMNDSLMNEKRQDMSYMSSKAEVFEQLEAAMASDSGKDLDFTISGLLDAFSELSTDPQDMSVRNSLVSKAQQLTNKFADISDNIDRTSDLLRDNAGHSISEINNLLTEIHGLNQSITTGEGKETPDNASLDLRVRKLQELSELTDFDVLNTDNGGIEIRIGGIQVLNADGPKTLRSEIDDVEKTFRVRLASGKELDVREGQLGAQVEMYEEGIPSIKENLDNLAATMVSEFNNIHSQGFGLEDNTPRFFFDPGSTTADTISLYQDIIDNPNHIAASSVAGEAGNAQIATRISDLRNEQVIQGRKMVDYAVNIISTPGANLSELNNKMEARDSEIQMLETQQQREAGVSIDEELSMMIQYQNAYQGAAKVMQAAQQMYDTLISIVR